MFGKKRYLRLTERLFGRSGRKCLNLYEGEGALGDLKLSIYRLEREVKKLQDNKADKKIAKKTTKKKK